MYFCIFLCRYIRKVEFISKYADFFGGVTLIIFAIKMIFLKLKPILNNNLIKLHNFSSKIIWQYVNYKLYWLREKDVCILLEDK